MSKYDFTLTTDRDKVRLLVGDTQNTDQMLEDEEIAFSLTESGNIYNASAFCCDIIAARFARDVNYRFSTFWQDSGDAYDHFKDLGDKYRNLGSQRSMLPVFTHSQYVVETAPEIFYYTIHDNPRTVTTENEDE